MCNPDWTIFYDTFINKIHFLVKHIFRRCVCVCFSQAQIVCKVKRKSKRTRKQGKKKIINNTSNSLETKFLRHYKAIIILLLLLFLFCFCFLWLVSCISVFLRFHSSQPLKRRVSEKKYFDCLKLITNYIDYSMAVSNCSTTQIVSSPSHYMHVQTDISTIIQVPSNR